MTRSTLLDSLTRRLCAISSAVGSPTALGWRLRCAEFRKRTAPGPSGEKSPFATVREVDRHSRGSLSRQEVPNWRGNLRFPHWVIEET